MKIAVLEMAWLIFFVRVKNSVGPFVSSSIEQWAYNYCDIKCNGTLHTMCKYPAGGGDSCKNNMKVYLNKDEKVYIEDNINRIRGLIATGQEKGFPKASNMMKLVWDRELSTIAKRWADQCTEGLHDECRWTSDEVDTGQNVYIGRYMKHSKGSVKMNRIKKIVEVWEKERKDFNQEWLDNYNTTGDLASNYTQLIWGITEFIGCGYTEFQMKGYVLARLVCNFKRRGNIIGGTVYRKGKPCSACPYRTHCSDTYKGMCWNGKFSNYTDVTDDAGDPFQLSLIALLVAFTILMVYR